MTMATQACIVSCSPFSGIREGVALSIAKVPTLTGNYRTAENRIAYITFVVNCSAFEASFAAQALRSPHPLLLAFFLASFPKGRLQDHSRSNRLIQQSCSVQLHQAIRPIHFSRISRARAVSGAEARGRLSPVIGRFSWIPIDSSFLPPAFHSVASTPTTCFSPCFS